MAEAHALPLPQPAKHILPEIRHEKGSLGSDVVAIRCGSKRMLKAAAEVLAESFRKGWVDLAQGIAVFMAPSRKHEVTAVSATGLVEALCLAKGIAVVSFKSTTVSAGEAGRDADPDESFLIGERAARFIRIKGKHGYDAAEADLGDAPPDLVVEVEHTHYDPAKADIYRAAGVKELWDLATGATGRSPQITDLQVDGGPQALEVSLVLPPIRADALSDALAELDALGGSVMFGVRMGRGEPVAERLLEVAGG